MGMRMRSECQSQEVMVRCMIHPDGYVESLKTFIFDFVPEDHTIISDDEWVESAINTISSEWLVEELKLELGKTYQVLMTVRVHGRWAGWESAEYDEELEILSSKVKQMPDDWLDPQTVAKVVDLRTDPDAEEN